MQELDDKEQIAFFASCLQCVYIRSKNYAKLRKYANITIEASKTPDGTMTHAGYVSADNLGWFDGNLEMCIEYLERGLVKSKKRHELVSVDDCYSRLCRTYRLVDVRKAIAYVDEAISYFEKKGRKDSYKFWEIKGELHLELGELDEAKRCYQELEERGKHSSEFAAELALIEGEVQKCLKEIYFRERELAEDLFDSARALAKYPKNHRIKGLALISQSNKTETKKELNKILALIDEYKSGPLPEIGMAYGECMLLADAMDEPEMTRKYYDRAKEFLASCEAKWYVEKLTYTFSQMKSDVETPVIIYVPAEQITLPSIAVNLFGGFEIFRGGLQVTDEEWRSRKAKNVLKYLLLNRGEPIVRDVLMDFFWRDMSSKRASLNLNATIYTIRRVLEPDRPRRTPSVYLFTEGDSFRFNVDADFWLDIAEFEKYMQQGKEHWLREEKEKAVNDWKKAIELYRGELLPEDRYEDWCILERERYKDNYVQILLKLGRYYYGIQELEKAVIYYKKVLSQEPVAEIAIQGLMQSLMKLNRRNEALSHYLKFEQALKSEFDAEPEEKTRGIYEQILKTLN